MSIGGTTVTSPDSIPFAAGVTQVPITFTLKGSNTFKNPNSNIQFQLTSNFNGTVVNTTPQNLPINNTQQFIVTNNKDYTPDATNSNAIAGSLRAVLIAAEAFQAGNQFPVAITFNIPDLPNGAATTAADQQPTLTISLFTPLDVTGEVLIDGGSQRGLISGNHIELVRNASFTGDDGVIFEAGAGGDQTAGSANSTLQDVEINGFTGNGIEIKANAVTIRSSTITGTTAGVSPGLGFAGDGIRIEASNDTIGDASASTLTANKIDNNSGYGIEIIGLVTGTMTATVMSLPVSYLTGSTAAISGTTIENNLIGMSSPNGLGGVFVEDGATVSSTAPGATAPTSTVSGSVSGTLIRSNTITNNVAFQVEVEGSTNTSIRTNSITGTSGTGIELSGTVVGATVTSNSVTITGGTGISATGTLTGAQLTGNTINGSGVATSGIAFGGVGGSVTIGGNNVSFSGTALDSGILLTNDSATVSVANNTVSGTTVAGINVSGSTGTTISGAMVTPTNGVGILSAGDNGITIGGSTISGTIAAGISLTGVGALSTSIVANKIFGTLTTGIAVAGSNSASGPLSITNNTIGGTGGLLGGTVGIIDTGISLDNAGQATVSQDTITNSGVHGILSSLSGTASGLTVANTLISAHAGDGIDLQGGTGIIVTQTTVNVSTVPIAGSVANGLGVGVSASGTSGLDIDTSSVVGSATTGILLSGTASSTVDGVTLNPTGGDGIEVDGGAGILLNDSNIGSSASGVAFSDGVLLSGNAAGSITGATVSGLTIFHAQHDGVLVNGLTDGVNIIDNGIIGSAVNGVEVTRNVPTGVTIGTTSVLVQENTIQGTNLSGTAPASSTTHGIYVHDLTSAAGPTDLATVKGNEVINQSGVGIAVVASDSVAILGNIVGTDPSHSSTISANAGDGVDVLNSSRASISGNAVYYSGGDGVSLKNSGGASVSANLVFHSKGDGLKLDNAANATLDSNDAESNLGSGIESLDNTAGTTLDLTSNTASNNTLDGIKVDGGAKTGNTTVLGLTVAKNTLTLNSVLGLEVTGAPGMTVTGNYIGTNINGTAGQGNSMGGVALAYSSYSTIEGNTIAGNDSTAMATLTASTLAGVTISGVGLDAEHSSNLLIQGNDVGLNPGGITVNGNGVGGIKITDPNGSVIRDNAVSGNGVGSLGFGLDLEVSGSVANPAAVLVTGNYVGTDSTGGKARGNNGTGIEVNNVPGLFLTNNLISGNTGVGLQVNGTSGLQALGNTVGGGKALQGTTILLGNGMEGILLTGTTDANVSGNTIVGNQVAGLEITGGTSSTTVAFNYIGTDSTRATGLGNLGDGVLVADADGVSITVNLVDSNSGAGLHDVGSSNLMITGNFIGTDQAGDVNLGNTNAGIFIKADPATQANPNPRAVSGVAIELNTIGDNGFQGVAASNTTGLLVQSNTIGFVKSLPGANGFVNLGNLGDGVQINVSDSATVIGNDIDANNLNGVEVGGATTNLSIVSNTIGAIVANANGAPGNVLNGVLILNVPAAAPGATTVTLSSNLIKQDGNDGLKLDDASQVAFGLFPNTIVGNGRDGVEVTNDSANINLNGGTIASNQGDGIAISNNLYGASTGGVTISGLTIGGATTPGISPGNLGNGIHVSHSKRVTITGVAIQSNSQDGLLFDASSQGNSVAASTIGGGAGLGNLSNGVQILSTSVTDFLFGNTITGDVISANVGGGVLIQGRGALLNTVKDSTIGGSTAALANGNDGVSLATAGTGNAITSNQILNNKNFGVAIGNTNSTTIAGDTIFGSTSNGVAISDSSSNNTLSGLTVASNFSNGVVISNGSANNLVSGSTIQENSLAGVLVLSSSNNTIGVGGIAAANAPSVGNTIISNETDGVDLFGTTGIQSIANSVAGNFIGTNAAGEVKGNKGDGVHVVDSASNVIGGTLDIDANIISANHQSGVEVFGNLSTNNDILGNVLGTLTANSLLGNQVDGVLISGTMTSNPAATPTNPQFNHIGAIPGVGIKANIIAGNQANGVAIVSADNNSVQGNFLGVVSGALAANHLDGITVQRSTGTVIDAGNIVAGNGVDGIDLLTSTAATVDDNIVKGNASDGIRVEEGSTGNFIGTIGHPNYVVGNANGAGIEVRTTATNNQILDNTVGLDFNGTLDPNGIGVYLNQVGGNYVGSLTTAGATNTITGNKVSGINITGNGSVTSANGVTTATANTVANNYVGVGSNGLRPVAFSSSTSDVGISVINSASNVIVGNVASGNHLAGIELFGAGSTFNHLAGNVLGADATTRTAVLSGGAVPDYGSYSLANRQEFGLFINGAPTNFVGPYLGFNGNLVEANEFGIDVAGGSNSDGNVIANNQVGPLAHLAPNYDTNANYPIADTTIPNTETFDGLGNFYGIFIDNISGTVTNEVTTSTTILGNTVDRNISIGLALSGPAATGNIVRSNHIDSTGGYSTDTGNDAFGNITPVELLSFNDAKAKALGGPVYIFGTGIYVNQGTNNVIGSIAINPNQTTNVINGTNIPENPAQGNILLDNKQVGIYVFNDGTTGSNVIRSNTTSGTNNNPNNAVPAVAPFNGDYGILLYNSSGNLSSPDGTNGVDTSGPYANVAAYKSNRIADFREFTGVVTVVTPDTLSGVTGYTSATPITAGGKTTGTKVAIKSVSASTQAIVKTVGKGHPLPPVMKSSARKR